MAPDTPSPDTPIRGHKGGRRLSGVLTMSLKVHECRMSAVECEKRAADTNDPALKQSYESLAKEWRAVAIEVERLESQVHRQ